MADDDLERNRGHTESTMHKSVEDSKILLRKFCSFTLTTMPPVIITVCFMLLLKLSDADTVVSAMVKVSQPFLVLAILTSLATWFCTGVWGSELETTSKESERELAVTEGGRGSDKPQSPADAESRLQECIRDFNFRYLLLVSMRTTYLFLFLLGCIFAGVGILRPPWFLLSVALSASLIFAITVVFHMYQDCAASFNIRFRSSQVTIGS